ncbi:protein of unknown function [Beijerinckiaceae bacterium RH AL1]|jgi:hypothetical protein|nr:hypothetical protein [Beijerinckiaceae bacterium]VVB45314.1 protein of unknown function [Beijerinckiaceae bacterium RH CH11]VVB45392.1 protein of unknown function [Beijerinckiaceae bacterium RH AL8]VVC54803.1 protein of unknown function [Beijerinckiaceae bacterium RH AL1]
MANHDTPEADPAAAAAHSDADGSYCCECGTYDAHKIRCLCCGFDFRTGPEATAAE